MKAILAALALASTPVAAFAASGQQSMIVKTDDLNLASEEGRKTLSLRIHRAARALCEGAVLEELPQTIRMERKCIKDARSNALAAAETKYVATRRASDRAHEVHAGATPQRR